MNWERANSVGSDLHQYPEMLERLGLQERRENVGHQRRLLGTCKETQLPSGRSFHGDETPLKFASVFLLSVFFTPATATQRRLRRPLLLQSLELGEKKKKIYIYIYTQTHTHTHTYIYSLLIRSLKGENLQVPLAPLSPESLVWWYQSGHISENLQHPVKNKTFLLTNLAPSWDLGPIAASTCLESSTEDKIIFLELCRQSVRHCIKDHLLGFAVRWRNYHIA